MSDVKALFVGQAYSRSSWYRICLPAMYMDSDWVGIGGTPPGLQMAAGWVNRSTQYPDFLDYDVVVMQQPRGLRWMEFIKKLRARDVTVLYEIDDYVHGIRKSGDHDFARYYDKNALKQIEVCMRACDGMICSTETLARLYRDTMQDRPIWVCENGLDLGRYALTRPPRGSVNGRETVTILWAGATGHWSAATPWLEVAARVMRRVDHSSFVSVGQDFAGRLIESFPTRVITVPFTSLECYPAAMMMGDVSIAPAGRSDWYRAKSDLRAMESQALGIPVVADEHYSSSVVSGETGIIVQNSTQAETALRSLVQDDDLRGYMSDKARERASSFSMTRRVSAWQTALAEAVTVSA